MTRAPLGGSARRVLPTLVAAIDEIGADVARRIAAGEIDDPELWHQTRDPAFLRGRAGEDVIITALCGYRRKYRGERPPGAPVCPICAEIAARSEAV